MATNKQPIYRRENKGLQGAGARLPPGLKSTRGVPSTSQRRQGCAPTSLGFGGRVCGASFLDGNNVE